MPTSGLGWEAPRLLSTTSIYAGAGPGKCARAQVDTQSRPHSRGAHSEKQAGLTATLGPEGPATGARGALLGWQGLDTKVPWASSGVWREHS